MTNILFLDIFYLVKYIPEIILKILTTGRR